MPIFIPDYLSRPAPTDDIATHTDTEGKGGYRIVSDLVERDAIVSSHRKFGMLVFCESDQQIYKLGIGLTNLDWEIFTASGGGLTPTAIQTSAYTANSNELVLCDTSGGGFTVTLPATPSNGEKVGILDVSNSFSETNKLTIDPGINEIIGSVDTLDITIGRSAITFICVDNGGVFGWHILDSIPNLSGLPNLDLSLSEINTGKKSFDGKDRYTKVINLGTIASGGVNFPHGIVGIDRVIDQYVIAKNTVAPYNQFKITGYQTTATDYVYVSDTEIRVYVVTGTLYNCYAILEYTKV